MTAYGGGVTVARRSFANRTGRRAHARSGPYSVRAPECVSLASRRPELAVPEAQWYTFPAGSAQTRGPVESLSVRVVRTGRRRERHARSPLSALRRPRPALRVSAADVCKQKREQNLGSSQGGNHPTRTAIGLYRTRIFILYKVWLSWGGSDHGRVSGVLYKVRPPRATGRARTSRDSATVPLRTAHAHVDTHERVCARMCVARWLEQPAPR